MSDFKKAKMTGWYDPGQLAKTGVQVAISTIFGRNADRRLFESAAKAKSSDPAKPFLDLSGQTGDFWFDYIADVGDGFNSTYTMAWHLTEPTLDISGHKTGRGKLLVFGGDEVYPTATQEFYENNLKGPYNTAFPKKDPPDPNAPHVFAIPGNHDWYDSLVQFSFLFLEKHFGASRHFCGWQLKQEKSYFAIKLPGGWWLFGTDMQLGSALDNPQMEYFFDLAQNHVQDGEKIILCNAEPHWITAAMYPDIPEYNNRNMGFFEGHILREKVAVHVAGDRHYYRRHEEITDRNGKPLPAGQSKIQKITAGGGGAFLHPTHNEKGVERVGRDHLYELKKSYPEPSTSFWLGMRNLAFPWFNPWFGIITAFLYVLTAWAFIAPIGQYGLADIYKALEVVLHRPVVQPIAFIWMAATVAGFIFFTDTNSKLYRWIAGPLHGIAHLAGVFFVSWAVSHHIDSSVGANPANWAWWQLLIGTLAIALGGYIVAPFIMGIYLLISLNLFKRHHNEAFSALKIQDYKNFLRFKIDGNGNLAIYPIGVKKAVRKWKSGAKGQRKVVPKEMDASGNLTNTDNRAFLIEGPIHYSKPVNPPPPTSPTPTTLPTP